MKTIYTFILAAFMVVGSLQAQTIEELKAQKSELDAKRATAQAEADALAGEIAGLSKEIDMLSGWLTGLSGSIGFNYNKSSNWIAAPNSDASSVGIGIGLATFANKLTDKTLWRNNLTVEKAWQKVNLSGVDDGTSIFDNGTVDILNLSSLYGYRIHPKIAITALGELNTSIENFLKPGSADIGVGATWTPNNNLVVVVHPFNYHVAWPADGTGVESTGALGAKVRADYGKQYIIGGKAFNVSSTFTTFFPYADQKSIFTNSDGTTYEAGLFEYTWLNKVSFSVFNGIGVGIGFGLRGADFESLDSQNFFKLGLNYSI